MSDEVWCDTCDDERADAIPGQPCKRACSGTYISCECKNRGWAIFNEGQVEPCLDCNTLDDAEAYEAARAEGFELDDEGEILNMDDFDFVDGATWTRKDSKPVPPELFRWVENLDDGDAVWVLHGGSRPCWTRAGKELTSSDLFVPYVATRALDRRVLAVARTRIEGAWGAYIAAVPGKSHETEASAVLREGAKLPEEIARAIFPRFKEVPYAR